MVFRFMISFLGCFLLFMVWTMPSFVAVGANYQNLDSISHSEDSTAALVVTDSIKRVLFTPSPSRAFPSFLLKYKTPRTTPIVYSKSQMSLKKRVSETDLIKDSLAINLKRDYTDLSVLESEYMINNPSLVRYEWSQIPEPSKLLERGFMKRASALAETKKHLIDIDDEQKKKIRIKKIASSPWKFVGVDYLQLQQNGYANWSQSDENNLTLSNDLRLKLSYKKDKSEWESFLVSKIGLNYTAEEATNVNDDQFELNTKYGYKASSHWYYSGSLNLKTQLFYDSYEDSNGNKVYKSGFMSPGYFTAAFGMDYKTDKGFSLLVAPLTSKIVFVTDTINIDQTQFGIEEGKRSHRQTGFSVVNFHKIPFTTLIIYTGRVELFVDYLTSQNRWFWESEHILDLRINRYLTTRIILEFRYLEAEIAGLQFKENVLIGFTYTF